MKNSLILSLAVISIVVATSAMEKPDPEITNLNPRRSGQPLTKQQMQESQLKKYTSHAKAKIEAKTTDQDLADFQQEQQNLMYQQQESSEESSSEEEPQNKKWYKPWKK
ncbi:MAG TPA: hypothetical protein VKU36_05755 [Candidatus Babeliales bacterium]|nr:hypothetical protein [Candidatus Babeliales bacterium]